MQRLITTWILLLVCTVLFAAVGMDRAEAQRKRGNKAPAKEQSKKPGQADKAKVFDFTGLDVSGQLRAPQLLYFLDRANQELQRASLERRSFIPEMVRSIDEEAL